MTENTVALEAADVPAWRTQPAGRELNVLVAARVMGWRVNATDYSPHTDTTTVRDLAPPDGMRGFETRGHVAYDVRRDRVIPDYSGDVTVAWTVLDHLLETRAFGVHVSATQEGGWNCFIDIDGRQVAAVDAEAPPLAICRAALEATKGRTPETLETTTLGTETVIACDHCGEDVVADHAVEVHGKGYRAGTEDAVLVVNVRLCQRCTANLIDHARTDPAIRNMKIVYDDAMVTGEVAG